MPTICPSRCFSILLIAALTGACATTQSTFPDTGDVAQEETLSSTQAVPVTRHGRYTLVELVPEAAQRYLMRQIVEVSIRRRSMPTWGMPCATSFCAPVQSVRHP
jgi:type IV pili sensor histidine kinase/response regulator